MLTSDLALVADADYLEIVTEFASDISSLDTAFAAAWQKLVESGNATQWATNTKCIDAADLATEYVSTSTATPGSEDDAASDGGLTDGAVTALLVVVVVLIVVVLVVVVVVAFKLKERGSSSSDSDVEMAGDGNHKHVATSSVLPDTK